MRYSKGELVVGKVTGITKYGVFMAFDDNYVGMVHISEISYDYVKDIHEYINIDDEIEVRILSVDNKLQRLQLSMKGVSDIKISKRRVRIKETPSGFSTLEKQLPIWVDNKLKNIREDY